MRKLADSLPARSARRPYTRLGESSALWLQLDCHTHLGWCRGVCGGSWPRLREQGPIQLLASSQGRAFIRCCSHHELLPTPKLREAIVAAIHAAFEELLHPHVTSGAV